VWVIWPDTHTVEIWTNTSMHTLTKDDTLDGGPILPGFTLLVAEIFPDITP